MMPFTTRTGRPENQGLNASKNLFQLQMYSMKMPLLCLVSPEISSAFLSLPLSSPAFFSLPISKPRPDLWKSWKSQWWGGAERSKDDKQCGKSWTVEQNARPSGKSAPAQLLSFDSSISTAGPLRSPTCHSLAWDVFVASSFYSLLHLTPWRLCLVFKVAAILHVFLCLHRFSTDG